MYVYEYTAFSAIFKSSLNRMLIFILFYHIMHFISASASVTFNVLKLSHLAGRASGLNHIFKRTSAFGY